MHWLANLVKLMSSRLSEKPYLKVESDPRIYVKSASGLHTCAGARVPSFSLHSVFTDLPVRFLVNLHMRYECRLTLDSLLAVSFVPTGQILPSCSLAYS